LRFIAELGFAHMPKVSDIQGRFKAASALKPTSGAKALGGHCECLRNKPKSMSSSQTLAVYYKNPKTHFAHKHSQHRAQREDQFIFHGIMSVAELAYTGFGTSLLRLNKTLQSICLHDVTCLWQTKKKTRKEQL
jgi:hypothetical protein